MDPNLIAEYMTTIQGLCPDDIGIDLQRIGPKTFERVWTLKDLNLNLINREEILKEINPAVSDIIENSKRNYTRPLWTKINVIDQADNLYAGIGLMNFSPGWLDFILRYLDYDRADESGDTLFIIFDLNFEWAIYFEFCQDYKELRIAKYKK